MLVIICLGSYNNFWGFSREFNAIRTNISNHKVKHNLVGLHFNLLTNTKSIKANAFINLIPLKSLYAIAEIVHSKISVAQLFKSQVNLGVIVYIFRPLLRLS